jgi:hypothetical protein
MKVFQFFRWMAVTLASWTWVLPVHPLRAAPPDSVPVPHIRPVPSIVDVALNGRGRLAGQLVDASGAALPGQTVAIQPVSGGEPFMTTSDANGRFALEAVRGGTYQVRTANAVVVCRCWTPGAAPPGASDQVLLVSGNTVQRGQYPAGEMLTPMIIGALIAAAIAIPILIHNSQDDAS